MDTRTLRALVLTLLDGGKAHARAAAVLDRFPVQLAGIRPPGCAHSAWELLEHLRIAQRDILDYCVDRDYEAPAWPEGYWPKTPAPRSAAAFRASARAFLADLAECAKIAKTRRDLLADLPNVRGVSWLQELFLIANHNSYHLGQLMMLRGILQATAKPAANAKPRVRRAKG